MVRGAIGTSVILFFTMNLRYNKTFSLINAMVPLEYGREDRAPVKINISQSWNSLVGFIMNLRYDKTFSVMNAVVPLEYGREDKAPVKINRYYWKLKFTC